MPCLEELTLVNIRPNDHAVPQLNPGGTELLVHFAHNLRILKVVNTKLLANNGVAATTARTRLCLSSKSFSLTQLKVREALGNGGVDLKAVSDLIKSTVVQSGLATSNDDDSHLAPPKLTILDLSTSLCSKADMVHLFAQGRLNELECLVLKDCSALDDQMIELAASTNTSQMEGSHKNRANFSCQTI